jgi:hypothetical protein
MLGIGSGDSIDSAQFAYTISRVESSDAVNASVPVGRIRCIQFVAASDPVDTRKTNDCFLMGKAKSPATPNTLVIPRSLSLDRTWSITVGDVAFCLGADSCNIPLVDPAASFVGADTRDIIRSP